MSRALQINSSPQGWMARNTKPVPLAEKGWAITMKKISIILLSAVLVFSMAACNGGKEKADNQTEKQTESVKPTEEVEMATKAVTEVTTEVGSEETEKDIAEVKDSEEKIDKEDNRSADNETDSKQEEKPKQNDEPEQKAPVNDNEEAGGNQSNAGNGGQTTDSPKDNVSNPQPASVAYSPQNVVSLATAKCQAGGMITTQQNLQNHLNDGSITQEEYNEYYPYDGMEGSYYSVFVETDLNKASGAELTGATLTVLDKDGNVVDTWTSDAKEAHVIKKLVVGETYTLREEFAPYGYLKATNIQFTVEDTGDVQHVEMKDEVPTGSIVINKDGEFVTDTTLMKGHWYDFIFNYFKDSLAGVTFDVYAKEDIVSAD